MDLDELQTSNMCYNAETLSTKGVSNLLFLKIKKNKHDSYKNERMANKTFSNHIQLCDDIQTNKIISSRWDKTGVSINVLGIYSHPIFI